MWLFDRVTHRLLSVCSSCSAAVPRVGSCDALDVNRCIRGCRSLRTAAHRCVPTTTTGGRSRSFRAAQTCLSRRSAAPQTRTQRSTGETERQTDARCVYLPKAISHGILKLWYISILTPLMWFMEPRSMLSVAAPAFWWVRVQAYAAVHVFLGRGRWAGDERSCWIKTRRRAVAKTVIPRMRSHLTVEVSCSAFGYVEEYLSESKIWTNLGFTSSAISSLLYWRWKLRRHPHHFPRKWLE